MKIKLTVTLLIIALILFILLGYKGIFEEPKEDYTIKECNNPNPSDFEDGYVKCEGKLYYSHFSVSKYESKRITKEVAGADLNTIKDLGEDYATDKNFVYYVGEIINEADPATFRILETESHNPNDPSDYPSYTADKNNVYKSYTKIIGADVKTFKYLSNFYSLDTDNVYYNTEQLLGADPLSFEVIGCWARDYAKDNSNVYQRGIKIIGADPKTFKPIGCGYYSKDKNSVYFRESKVAGADPDTFEKTEYSTRGKDKNFIYEGTEKIGPVNP